MSSNKKPTDTGVKEDTFLDQTLRPNVWDEYIGQKNTKENLKILLRAAKERGHPPEHLMFYGPPGLGKTTLAHLVAKEIGSQIKVTSGPTIEKVGDLASVLTNLSPGDVLFIDEIHRLNKTIEEVLYPAMESGVLNIILGKGPSARTIALELPPFTLVAATTRVAMVSAPLRSRFSGGVFRLDFYNLEDIEKIIERSAKILGVSLPREAVQEISKRSRFTPRTANYILKRCRDFAQIKKEALDKKTTLGALDLIGIDEAGLLPSDRQLLTVLIEKFGGGPVGLGTISAALSEDEDSIEEYNEPYLIQIGFLERTPRGRTVTEHGYRHMNKTPKPSQKKLI